MGLMRFLRLFFLFGEVFRNAVKVSFVGSL